jgi:hypothetical protein
MPLPCGEGGGNDNIDNFDNIDNNSDKGDCRRKCKKARPDSDQTKVRDQPERGQTG